MLEGAKLPAASFADSGALGRAHLLLLLLLLHTPQDLLVLRAPDRVPGAQEASRTCLERERIRHFAKCLHVTFQVDVYGSILQLPEQ
jgi:hypothetical protein